MDRAHQSVDLLAQDLATYIIHLTIVSTWIDYRIFKVLSHQSIEFDKSFNEVPHLIRCTVCTYILMGQCNTVIPVGRIEIKVADEGSRWPKQL